MSINPGHPLAALFGSTEGSIKLLSLVLWKMRATNGGLALDISAADVRDFQLAMTLRGAAAFVRVEPKGDGVCVSVCDENRGGMLIDLAGATKPVPVSEPANGVD